MSGQWLTKRRGGTALAVGAVLALSGCGGSSGGGEAAGQGATAGLAKAQALVKQASVRPSSVGLAGPVGKPIPTGKKVVFISCGVQACDIQGDILARAPPTSGGPSRRSPPTARPSACRVRS